MYDFNNNNNMHSLSGGSKWVPETVLFGSQLFLYDALKTWAWL